MATNRSRRLRKKLCVDEFQELGFELNLEFKSDLDIEAIDAFLDQFLAEAMDANNLDYVGGEGFGLVCLAERGSRVGDAYNRRVAGTRCAYGRPEGEAWYKN